MAQYLGEKQILRTDTVEMRGQAYTRMFFSDGSTSMMPSADFHRQVRRVSEGQVRFETEKSISDEDLEKVVVRGYEQERARNTNLGRWK